MISQPRPRPRQWLFVVVGILGLVGACAAAPVADEAQPVRPPVRAPAPGRRAPATAPDTSTQKKTPDFIRFVEDDDGGGRLESAVVTYRNAAGVTIHLVAALHVGEESYYRGLTRTFKTYDALLYELVKAKGSDVPKPGVRAGGAVSGLQRFLKDVLELEFQLDQIDYTAPNFVHADLDAETFFSLQEKRGESLFSLMLRAMLSEMQRQSQGKGARPITLIDLLAAMNSPDSARQYKLLLARQFQDIEAQIAGVEGQEGTVLVTERNKAALRVLRETIGKGRRNIGIFYGAGHMRGLEDALLGQMGFRRTGIEWRVAWDMTAPVPTTRPATRPATRPMIRPVPKTAPVPASRGKTAGTEAAPDRSGP